MTNAKTLAKGTPLAIEYATCSDIGLKRTMNQDSFESRIADDDDLSSSGHLFVVADGMGAHAAGELASRLAVDEIKLADGPEEHSSRLREHFQKANSIIHEQGQSNPQYYNMGTTGSALWLLKDEGAIVAHVGDSRVYRCRGQLIEQITFDHSLVWEMRAAGQFSNDNSTIPRNVITRCLGPHAHVEVDQEGPFSVEVGDTFLLCSDGLTGRISDAELGVATRYLSPSDAAEFLVDLANLRGGHDNITVTVVRVTDAKLRSTGKTVESDRNDGVGTHPAWWFLAGLGMVAALASASYQSLPGLLISGAVLLIACAYILLQWSQRQADQSAPSGMPSPPYALASSDITEQILEQFKDTFVRVADQNDTAIQSKIDAIPEMLKDEDPTELCLRIREVAQQLRNKA